MKIFTNLFLAEVNDKHHQNMDVVATFALPDEITCASEELKVGISIWSFKLLIGCNKFPI